MLRLLTAAVLLAASAHGHANLRQLNGVSAVFYDTQSQVAPCGAGTPNANLQKSTFRRGDMISAMRFTGGHNGQDTYTIIPADGSGNPAAGGNISDPNLFNNGVAIGTFDHAAGSPPPNANTNELVSNVGPIPSTGVPDGEYILQWRWSGYYSCALLDVAGDCLVTEVPVNFGAEPKGTTLSGRTVVSTQATPLGTKKFRLWAESISGGELKMGQVFSACPASQPSWKSEGTTPCMQIPAEAGTKYYEIDGSGEKVDFFVEEGDCDEINSAPASAASAALALGAATIAALV